MIATVHEFGQNIKPKSSQFLSVPCNPKTKGKNPREFNDLYVLEDSKGQFWLVRNKGKDEIEFMYMLAREINIPERSFIRGAFDSNLSNIQSFIDRKIDELFAFKINIDQFYKAIGEYIVSIIKKYMTDLKEPPKSPITLAANPTKTNPLIDSGQLRNSVVWKLKEGDFMDMILDEFKTKLQLIKVEKGQWDREEGEYIEGISTTIDFVGAVLPLSQDDFIKNPDGGFTRNDKKLYTGIKLTNGQEVIWNNSNWKIDSDLDYEYIDVDFKRYLMRKLGVVSD